MAMWDVETGQRLRKFRGHSSFVQTCAVTGSGVERVATAGDDGCIQVSYHSNYYFKHVYYKLRRTKSLVGSYLFFVSYILEQINLYSLLISLSKMCDKE
jgi:hypothetical protein